MKNHGEIAITLSVIALMVMTAGAILGYSLSNQTLSRSSNAQTTQYTDLGQKSRWFEGAPGLACNTWLTCETSGSKIEGVYLEQGGTRYPLGGAGFVDKFGKSPVNVVYTSCEGHDEVLSVQYNPAVIKTMSPRFLESYQINPDTSIILSMQTGGGAPIKYYIYNRPAGSSLGAQDAKLVVEYEATTAGTPAKYSQYGIAKTCALPATPVPTAGGGGVPATPLPSTSAPLSSTPQPTRSQSKAHLDLDVILNGTFPLGVSELQYAIYTCDADSQGKVIPGTCDKKPDNNSTSLIHVLRTVSAGERNRSFTFNNLTPNRKIIIGAFSYVDLQGQLNKRPVEVHWNEVTGGLETEVCKGTDAFNYECDRTFAPGELKNIKVSLNMLNTTTPTPTPEATPSATPTPRTQRVISPTSIPADQLTPTATPAPTISGPSCILNAKAHLYQCADTLCARRVALPLDAANQKGFFTTNDKKGAASPFFFQYTPENGQFAVPAETVQSYAESINEKAGGTFGGYANGSTAVSTLSIPSNYQIMANTCTQKNGTCVTDGPTSAKIGGLQMSCGNVIDYGWTMQKCEAVGSVTYGCSKPRSPDILDDGVAAGYVPVHSRKFDKNPTTGIGQLFISPQDGQLSRLKLDLLYLGHNPLTLFTLHIAHLSKEDFEPIEGYAGKNRIKSHIDLGSRDIATADISGENIQNGQDIPLSSPTPVAKGEIYFIYFIAANETELYYKDIAWAQTASADNCMSAENIEVPQVNAPTIGWPTRANFWLNSNSGSKYVWDFRFTATIDPVNSCTQTSNMLAAQLKKADLDGNGVVNTLDYVTLAEALGQTGVDMPEDINSDGVVDGVDISNLTSKMFLGTDAYSPSSAPVESGTELDVPPPVTQASQ